MDDKKDIRNYGYHVTPFYIYSHMKQDTKDSNSLVLSVVLSALYNFSTFFPANGYGIRINMVYFSDLLGVDRKSIRTYLTRLESYGYIETQTVRNTKYYKMTRKSKNIFKKIQD